MMKVIFLDIDGVLVNRASFRLPGSGSADRAIAHPDCVAALNHILERTGASIVVTSVWRYDGLMKVKERLAAWGVLPGRVIGITPVLCRTEKGWSQGLRRGDEIQRWMDDYQRETIEAFVILDDDSDMKHLLPYLVLTNTEQGLTMEDAQRAIEMLEGPER